MAKKRPAPRPTKKSEYEILCASRDAEKGWRDLCATQRNALADSWDFLTKTPLEQTPRNYPLKGELGKITRDGRKHDRWQHKPTLGGSARIWFYVDGPCVYLERVPTAHPHETK
ncbi:hypothetical protein ACFFFR_08660 [Micrococcoides hystricis]|uniref:Cytotoxic translational repressor of toxin-antitoxin stability system n=1 Tax=Micrococcoides hystricis TaxID=1572761 RepID=A0ABV6PBE7_9MICC